MKLIVTGATGFIGTEVIRQALSHPSVDTVIALARREVPTPDNLGPNADASKLQSVILEDWTGPYPESVLSKLQGADACIWALGINAPKSRGMDFADVCKVCFDYTTNGIENMQMVANEPFRFVYNSGVLAERDQSKTPPVMGDHLLMRGRVESAILTLANRYFPPIHVTSTRPSFTNGPGRAPPTGPLVMALKEQLSNYPEIHVSELAAVMIDQCVSGITRDPLEVPEMIAMSRKLIKKEDYLK